MGFGKAFGFSMLTFIGLNVVFFFAGYGILGTLGSFFTSLSTTPSNILIIFLGPIISGQFPLLMTSTFTSWFSGVVPAVGNVFLFIGYIVAPILAAYLSGRYGENKIDAFFGWFTTVMICAIITLIVGTIELVLSGAPFTFILSQIFGSIAIGLVYAMGCGSISLLTLREL